MLDIQNEQLLRLRDARKLPWFRGRSGGQLDIGTLRRWALKGVKGITLETVRIGGTTFTSSEACVRFVEKLSSPTGRSLSLPSRRRQAIAEADHRLDEAGIK
jgi:hypothetical protein